MRIAFQHQTRVAFSLKFASKEDKHNNHVFINEIYGLFPKERSMSLLLQSVQQYTGKGNRQLHRFNSTLTRQTRAQIGFRRRSRQSNFSWRLQTVQQHITLAKNSIQIDQAQAFQKIASPIMKTKSR